MNDNEQYENGILTIRFTGRYINDHGVSIYDLGTSLISIQRIINKAHLSLEGDLRKGAFLDRKSRLALSLSIGERRRSSDAFALVPLLTDPYAIEYVKQVAGYVVSGIVGYYVGDVIERLRGGNENEKQFIGSIHADVVNIVNRIETTGGIETIEVGAPALGEPLVARFDEQSKGYVNDLSNEYFLGKNQTITGSVYRLYPNTSVVTIARAGGRKVNIYLDPEDFDQIRYRTQGNPLVSFNGRPRYKLGIESQVVTEFEAASIVIEEDG